MLFYVGVPLYSPFKRDCLTRLRRATSDIDG